MQTVSVETIGRIAVVTIERPDARNAVDAPTAQQLYEAFKSFDADPDLDVAVLQGRLPEELMVSAIATATRQYAKRQEK